MRARLFKLLAIDPGLAMALLLATFAAWPFLTRHSLPTFTDVEHHVYRTYEIMSAWKQGVLYLRWAPDLFFGYGYPIFNYYAPLTHYLGAAYGWCFGGPVAGVKFVLVASAYVGAVGMYLLGRDHYGGMAGVVSAATYVFAPYVVYINPHARGVSPETFAVALGPWLLWAFARLRSSRTASPGALVLAALTLTALTLSHNLVSFLFLGMLLAWLAWELIFGPSGTPRRRVILMSGAALLLGFGLAAFMWLPAALERNATQFQRAFTLTPAQLHFLGVQELFGPASLAEVSHGDIKQVGRFRIGIAQWVLGALGTITIVGSRLSRLTALREQHSTTLFFTLAALALIYFMLPISLPIWSLIPPLMYLQFPWRLLGPAAVAFGMLAGAAARWVGQARPWGRVAFSLAAVAACIATAMPLMDPLPWADYGPVTPQRIFVMEQNGALGIGTTIQWEFLPVGVTSRPLPVESLIRSYDMGLVDKINHATLPEGTQVTVLEHGPEHDRFLVTGRTDFDLNVFTFYFPGWTAYVGDVPTPISVLAPEGFIAFRVPAGNHEVLLRLENTPPRWLGWGLSALAGIALLGFALRQLRFHPTGQPRETIAWRFAVMLGTVVLGGLGARYIADQASPWRADLPSYEVPGAQHQHFERWESNLALLAYDLAQSAAHPGDQVPLTLYWKALGRVPLDLSVFVHFIGPDGQLWGQSDKLVPVEYFPTGRWPLNRYFRDDHQANLRPDAPPGEYTVRAGLWDEFTDVRMHVLDANGNVTDQDGTVLTTKFVVQP